MSRHQVFCINKRGGHDAAHERISSIGGLNSNGIRWKLTEDEAIKSVEDGKFHFYVNINGRSVDIVVAHRGERKYLKTEADGYNPDNLLNLPECP